MLLSVSKRGLGFRGRENKFLPRRHYRETLALGTAGLQRCYVGTVRWLPGMPRPRPRAVPITTVKRTKNAIGFRVMFESGEDEQLIHHLGQRRRKS